MFEEHSLIDYDSLGARGRNKSFLRKRPEGARDDCALGFPKSLNKKSLRQRRCSVLRTSRNAGVCSVFLFVI